MASVFFDIPAAGYKALAILRGACVYEGIRTKYLKHEFVLLCNMPEKKRSSSCHHTVKNSMRNLRPGSLFLRASIKH